jgi:hypothetical protein
MSDPLRVFIGYDERQPLAFTVLSHSIARHSSVPVSITPLILPQLPIKRRGLTSFTYSRFLVPFLCGYRGVGLFLDADMVVTSDIKNLFGQSISQMAVHVMQEQPKFEWASAMLFNNYICKNLTPEFVDDESNKLFDFEWARGRVGTLPPEWNHCVGYTKPKEAKLYHYTQGLPCLIEPAGLSEDQHWHAEFDAAIHTVPWSELMGNSVHAEPVMRRFKERNEHAYH